MPKHITSHPYVMLTIFASRQEKQETIQIGFSWLLRAMVGYHQAYGLTGALPADHNGNPQGYRRGDMEIAEFFRMMGPQLRPTFFLDAEFVPQGNAEKPKDWFATPKAAHMRFSDP
eukprot:5196255-Karenia_brevis.AAC.1